MFLNDSKFGRRSLFQLIGCLFVQKLATPPCGVPGFLGPVDTGLTDHFILDGPKGLVGSCSGPCGAPGPLGPVDTGLTAHILVDTAGPTGPVARIVYCRPDGSRDRAG
jgi:hypothetical protein